jgi:carbon-monoxide dehydrogenase medium subunit
MMKPAPFSYHRARSADEAVSLLAELGDDAKLIAGGQSLVAMMNFRLARPAALVDISRLAELRYVRRHDAGLRIGALALHRDLERLTDSGVAAGFGMLPRAARHIGHYAIRAAGTFGGSIAHADPAAEWCMAALLFDAQIMAHGPGGDRLIPATGFFRGFLETELRADEMIVEVRLPAPRP